MINLLQTRGQWCHHLHNFLQVRLRSFSLLFHFILYAGSSLIFQCEVDMFSPRLPGSVQLLWPPSTLQNKQWSQTVKDQLVWESHSMQWTTILSRLQGYLCPEPMSKQGCSPSIRIIFRLEMISQNIWWRRFQASCWALTWITVRSTTWGGGEPLGAFWHQILMSWSFILWSWPPNIKPNGP